MFEHHKVNIQIDPKVDTNGKVDLLKKKPIYLLDIARIMREQNQTFLSLANRAVALDEQVKLQKDHYSQYLKMYG